MKKMIILLGCVGCMMLSCSKDPQDTNSKQSGNNVHEWEDSTLSGDAVMGEMKFSVNNVMSVERQGSTRSTTEYNGACAFSEGDRIAIRVSRNSVVEDVKLYEVQLDGSLECLDTYPFTWRSLSDAVDIQAWSYGDASTTKAAPEDSDYSLETNQQTNGYRELLYCNALSTGYSANSITLNFYHQLARVVFNVTHERTNTLTISSKAVGNTTTFPKTATFNVPTGNNTVGTWDFTTSTYGTIIPKTENTQGQFQATFSAVIFPTKTYAQNTQFFTINNSEGNYVYKISETTGFTPTAGNQYNYTITVKNHANSISDATIYNIHIGDIVCSDGTIYHSDVAASQIATNSKTPVGIVVFVNSNDYNISIFNTAGDVATEKNLGRYSTKSQGRALVMCLKNLPSKTLKNTTSVNAVDPTNINNASDYPAYAYTVSTNNSSNPASYGAYNYTGLTAPSASTGWFLPSIGQWRLIIAGLTDYKYLGDFWATSKNSAYTGAYIGNQINTAMANAGSGNYDQIDTTESTYFWTSTGTGGANILWSLFWDLTKGPRLGGHGNASFLCLVRPVLAF